MPDRTRNAQRSAAPAQERAGRLDWGNLRFFLELSRTGSLSRAAQRLGVDRNTVARRVAALEEELGLPLFAIARHADARDPALSGTVRLTTATHLAAFLLAPALPRLRERHPGLVLEIAADQRTFDLTRREADLALRFGRPRDAGLVTRKLSDVAYGLYAGTGYAGGRRAVDLERDAFVGFDESLAGVPQERWLARVAPARRVVFRSNSTASLQAAARAGIGVAVLPCFVAGRDPAHVRLEGPEPENHELWLLVHGDLRRTPRVRAVIEWVDALVEGARSALCGTP